MQLPQGFHPKGDSVPRAGSAPLLADTSGRSVPERIQNQIRGINLSTAQLVTTVALGTVAIGGVFMILDRTLLEQTRIQEAPTYSLEGVMQSIAKHAKNGASSIHYPYVKVPGFAHYLDSKELSPGVIAHHFAFASSLPLELSPTTNGIKSTVHSKQTNAGTNAVFSTNTPESAQQIHSTVFHSKGSASLTNTEGSTNTSLPSVEASLYAPSLQGQYDLGRCTYITVRVIEDQLRPKSGNGVPSKESKWHASEITVEIQDPSKIGTTPFGYLFSPITFREL